MSNAGAQAWAFYREVAKNRLIWTVRDGDDFITSDTSEGTETQPFWSSLSRVKRIIKTVPTFSECEPFEISWDDFCMVWVPRLTKEGKLAGVNWSGKRAVGFDLKPERVKESVEALIANPELRPFSSSKWKPDLQ